MQRRKQPMTIASPTRFEEPETSPSASAIGSPSRLHLDLFTGIGGFTIAAQAAGYKTIGFSETNPYDCKLLKELWPDVPNLGDIRNVRNIRADLVTGGFPCQPYSTAGKRAGASDDRALWPEMCRVIAESKPRWVLGENVAGIISMELDRVLDDLESLGYAAWPIVIPACAVDAKHRRDRVWIVAHANLDANNADAQPLHKTDGVQKINRAEVGSGLSCGTGGVEDGKQWTPEPGMDRVADGIPNRAHRLKALGNAIVPQVATVILKMMARMENH